MSMYMINSMVVIIVWRKGYLSNNSYLNYASNNIITDSLSPMVLIYLIYIPYVLLSKHQVVRIYSGKLYIIYFILTLYHGQTTTI